MENHRLAYLFQLFIKKEITAQERTELYRLMSDAENEEQVKQLLDQSWDEFTPGQQVFTASQSERMLDTVFRPRIAPQAKRLFPWKKISIAAAILIFITAGLYFWKVTNIRQQPETFAEIPGKEKAYDIGPGKDQAVLILADGSKIILDNHSEGTVSQQGNTKVIQLDGQLVYNAQHEDKKNPVYNTIRTPKAGRYQVVLPDGTKVWLNAGSALTFPTAFTGSERRVQLEGEAYFEVSKKERETKRLPFIVTADGQQVEVLGTHFNVMAYQDETEIKTTLLEGSVRVFSLKSQRSNLLKPGQQSSLKQDGSIHVAEVNTEEAVAWKDGYFQFDGADIKTIMRQLSRWYDVEVVYTGNLPSGHYRGKVSRNVPVSDVLRILELSGINFTIKEGRKIIVKP